VGLGVRRSRPTGDGTTVGKSSPIQVGALTTWSEVAGGVNNVLALKTDGTLWSWGRNSEGQLGLNDQVNRSSPVQIGSYTTWSAIASGGYHVLAVKTDGTLWAWGYNGSGATGAAPTYSSPVQVGALTTWLKVAGGKYHSLATKTDGTLWAFGKGAEGQLGDGSTVNKVLQYKSALLLRGLQVQGVKCFLQLLKPTVRSGLGVATNGAH